MNNIKRFGNNLKSAAIENPLLAVALGAAVVTATAKLLDANTQRTYAKAHTKEIERRMRLSLTK